MIWGISRIGELGIALDFHFSNKNPKSKIDSQVKWLTRHSDLIENTEILMYDVVKRSRKALKWVWIDFIWITCSELLELSPILHAIVDLLCVWYLQAETQIEILRQNRIYFHTSLLVETTITTVLDSWPPLQPCLSHQPPLSVLFCRGLPALQERVSIGIVSNFFYSRQSPRSSLGVSMLM